MTLLELATQHLDKKAPYSFKDTSEVLKADGKVRQSEKLKNLIKRQHSSRASMSGISVYVLRLGSQFNGYSYLAFSEYDNAISIH